MSRLRRVHLTFLKNAPAFCSATSSQTLILSPFSPKKRPLVFKKSFAHVNFSSLKRDSSLQFIDGTLLFDSEMRVLHS